ncbi:MAG: hypothetical protein RH860_07010 [Cytophagales bacterium]
MKNQTETPPEQAPFFKTWKRLYIFVMAFFISLVGLFYLLSSYYK